MGDRRGQWSHSTRTQRDGPQEKKNITMCVGSGVAEASSCKIQIDWIIRVRINGRVDHRERGANTDFFVSGSRRRQAIRNLIFVKRVK